MSLFINVSVSQILNDRNKIFQDKGVPALLRNNFLKSPYKASWDGKNNIGGYTYDHCRLEANSQLQCVTTYISKNDRWIQIFLNIFQLHPHATHISQLHGLNGIQFRLPPNSISRLRLKQDGYHIIPLLRDLFVKQHKLGSFYTKNGYDNRLVELGNLIEDDLININSFVKRWHEMYKPLVTDWEGHKILK